jgi:hypothetical protein
VHIDAWNWEYFPCEEHCKRPRACILNVDDKISGSCKGTNSNIVLLKRHQ